MEEQAMTESLVPKDDGKGRIRWFSPRGCVVEQDGRYEIFVGGMLVGAWNKDDTRLRNALVVTIAEAADVHLGKLAKAFRLSSERLRQLRIAYAEGGVAAVATPARIGRKPKLTAKIRAKLEKMFAQGLSIDDVHKKMRHFGRSTIGHAHTAWRKKKAQSTDAEATASSPEQITLPGVKRVAARPREPEEIIDAPLDVASAARGGFVQHAGTWLMLGMLDAQGLYAAAARASDGRVKESELRVAFDAVACALTIGQRCVEGVRRIATSTAPMLLRASACPSPPTVRAVLRELSEDIGAIVLHAAMLRSYLAGERRTSGVYYVDNHLRRYSGKHTIRRGWRMQDKHVVPGITDYYVHDEEGRPLFRIDVPSHDSLTQWLAPIAKIFRDVVGEAERVLLAFDRGGSFPEAMAGLRDGGFEFVTYERRPYQILPETAFSECVKMDDEELRFIESQTNLGKGRGRVRRIAVRDPDDGRQINLLAVSELPASRLIEIMRSRWLQENAFKHGVERWGINQLDRRKVEAYPPDAIIPNPARSRLDREARDAAIREGDARCLLAQLGDGDRRRVRIEKELDAAVQARRDLDTERADEPKRARLSETELAGKLVRHDGKVKLSVDTIRIACANVESELAGLLAPRLAKPREAKKTLANLFAAPGRIRVKLRTISIELAPASTHKEQLAFNAMLEEINRRKLTLPGDALRRKLRFRSQIL